SLAWALLRIGAVAFGGLGATLVLLNRDLVERRGWLQSSDVTEALAYTKPLPGSTIVQIVTFLGCRLAGSPGAILGTSICPLIARVLVIGTLAFGGGQAALPLVERLAVADTGWLTPAQFATAVGLSYATPGPVLILAAFIGYYVAAFPGALAATAAVFAAPVAFAGFAARLVNKLKDAGWFQAFGRFAAAAAVGLLGVTLIALARPVLELHGPLLLGAVVVFVAALRGIHPIVLVAAATVLGAAVSLIG